MRFVGRISYGIYLYHLFLIPIGLATISWYAIEAPINRQKRRFPYPPKRATPPSAI